VARAEAAALDPAVPVGELTKLVNIADRAVRRLGLKIEAASGPPRGLERARARWAQQESNKAAKAARRGKQSAKRERPPGHDPTQTETD
jgi:hypothetical protein